MLVQFEQPVVNGSEGNIAVVCASANFPTNQEKINTSEELFSLDISVVEGSAGEYIHLT